MGIFNADRCRASVKMKRTIFTTNVPLILSQKKNSRDGQSFSFVHNRKDFSFSYHKGTDLMKLKQNKYSEVDKFHFD